ncbi:MAG: hypothetical protein PVI82_11990 [Desulfobacterales bacterium]|jgi:hypothetical protein
MKSKILILALMITFAFGGVACAQDIKYAVIQIPTDPKSAEFKEGVQIFFLDKDGNRHEGKDYPIPRWPIPVEPENMKGDQLFVDQAMWHISNPTCVTWDNRRK